MSLELSLGNMLIIGLGAFLAVPAILLASKYLVKWNIPVLSDVGAGMVTIWRVAA